MANTEMLRRVDYPALDSWKVKPPCTLDEGCPTRCPYHLDCWGEEDDIEGEA